MGDAKAKTGHFVFSLDTELAWGCYDLDRTRCKRFSPDGSRERGSIELLLDMLDEFGIVATWAVVGHLFYQRCEECDLCPVLAWEGKYRSFEEIYKTDKPLWYGADVVEALLASGSRHEIAFHGYTHRVFDENTMSEEEARVEIQEWLRVAEGKGTIPRAVVFPRDRVGYLHLFKEAGFLCYRSDVHLPRLLRVRYVSGLFKSIDHLLALSTPPVYELDVEASGLVNIRSSQHLFGFNRRLERVLDSLGLHKLRINRIIKGVKKAADEKSVVHIWAHPWEFRTRRDFEKLRYLLTYVSQEMKRGRIRPIGMTDMARMVIAQQAAISTRS